MRCPGGSQKELESPHLRIDSDLLKLASACVGERRGPCDVAWKPRLMASRGRLLRAVPGQVTLPVSVVAFLLERRDD